MTTLAPLHLLVEKWNRHAEILNKRDTTTYSKFSAQAIGSCADELSAALRLIEGKSLPPYSQMTQDELEDLYGKAD